VAPLGREPLHLEIRHRLLAVSARMEKEAERREVVTTLIEVYQNFPMRLQNRMARPANSINHEIKVFGNAN